MKFRPLHDRVVVERLEAEEKTASGIIIPDSAQEKPMQGKIIAAGSGARDETGKVQPLDVKENDVVDIGAFEYRAPDADGDLVADTIDNCLNISNIDQHDMDQDNLGDACDLDIDGDGVVNLSDFYPLIGLGVLPDTDGDGRPDECDGSCTFLGMVADGDDDNDVDDDDADNPDDGDNEESNRITVGLSRNNCFSLARDDGDNDRGL